MFAWQVDGNIIHTFNSPDATLSQVHDVLLEMRENHLLPENIREMLNKASVVEVFEDQDQIRPENQTIKA